jgi:hypothetical protein
MSTAKEAAKKITVLFVACVIIVGLAVGGWTLHWFLARSTAGHIARIKRTTFEFQQTYRQEITRKLADVATIDVQLVDPTTDKVTIGAQRKAIVAIVCGDASFIVGDPLPANQAAFIAKECS